MNLTNMLTTYYKNYKTSEYEAIQNPQEHFSHLANQMKEQMAQVQAELEHKNPGNDLPWLEKVGHHNNLRKQAEEIVVEEWMPPFLGETS